MDINEKNALMEYLESRLLDFCDHAEKQHKNGGIATIYDEMYSLLSDVECSIAGKIEFTTAMRHKEKLDK